MTEVVRVEVGAADGTYIVGEFIGFRDRAPREVGGRTYTACEVGVRIAGNGVETVQYNSRQDAEAAMRGAQIGERVAVLVENKFGVKNGRAWQFYGGPRSNDPGQFASEFGD